MAATTITPEHLKKYEAKCIDPARDPCRVLTGACRLSFPNLFKPQQKKNTAGDTFDEWGCSLLIPKDAPQLAVLKAAAAACVKARFGDQPPKGIKSPFLDGDLEQYSGTDGYEKCIFLRTKSRSAPGVVDQLKKRLTEADSDRIYAGCWVRATIRCSYYDKETGKGVSFWLDNVQLLGDGEPFASKRKAEDDFDAADTPTAADPVGGPAYDHSMF